MICNQNTKREALGVLVFGGILERIKVGLLQRGDE